MPEDRFGDLGPRGERESPGAAERLADLDERDPDAKPPDRHRGPRAYTWVVGVAAVILIAVVGLNSIPNAGEGIRGPQPGSTIPAFAAPSATGSTDADVNVKQSAKDDRFQNKTAACAVRGPGIVNICDLRRRRPVVITFLGVPGAKKCEDQLDRIDQLREEFPRVAFVAVVSGRERKAVASLVKRHGWGLPVAVDRRGDLFTLYRAAICPTTVFAHAGGVVKETTIRPLSDERFRTLVRSVTRPPATTTTTPAGG